MNKDLQRITAFVTGGAGFIGSNLVRYLINHTDYHVVNLDKLTYAGNINSLMDLQNSSRYNFERVDICNESEVNDLFQWFEPDYVFHLAAESHVDRSIDGPSEFIHTNIVGTYNLLSCAQRYWGNLNTEKKSRFRFLHVSTDEVYGSLGETGLFNENTPYDPRSPYSASKASADHLVSAWHHTYGLPTIITNCSNNYGPYQFPEKLIPVIILNALNEKPIPIYGDGKNVRDWLYVEDHVRALILAIRNGGAGEKYNIGGSNERANLEIVESICTVLDEMKPRNNGASYKELISFVRDRPGHDRRYAIDASKAQKDLGFSANYSFEEGVRATVSWYLDNTIWCNEILATKYHLERLGVSRDRNVNPER